jgi:quinol monooxygenase YgiN
MYGTIFNLSIKLGHEETLLTALKEDVISRKPEGMIGWFVMNPDDKDEWMGVAIFESREAYVANANSPEQHESFLKLMEHLESEPTWTDGTYVIGEIDLGH